MAVLKQYTAQHYGVEESLPLYQTTSLMAAAKQLKIKLDKKKLQEASGAQKKVFDKLLLELIKLAELIDKKVILRCFLLLSRYINLCIIKFTDILFN